MILRVRRFRRAGVLAPIMLLTLSRFASASVASVVMVLTTPNPAVNVQQSVTITAGVNSTAGVSATGTITINDTCPSGNTVLLGTITLGSSTSATPGAGTLVISNWPCLGGNSLQAYYGGDANYSPGVSQPLLETILSQYTATSTNLSSSANPATAGQSVTLAATLTFTLTRTTYPTGTVTFKDTNTGTVLGTPVVQTWHRVGNRDACFHHDLHVSSRLLRDPGIVFGR